MSEFEGIRPYNDAEVPAVLERLLSDQELMRMLAGYRFPRLNRWLPGVARSLVQLALGREARGVESVDDLQHRLEPYLDRLIWLSPTVAWITCAAISPTCLSPIIVTS